VEFVEFVEACGSLWKRILIESKHVEHVIDMIEHFWALETQDFFIKKWVLEKKKKKHYKLFYKILEKVRREKKSCFGEKFGLKLNLHHFSRRKPRKSPDCSGSGPLFYQK
jgi:hypothetical protein